jgi:hypothetical protein
MPICIAGMHRSGTSMIARLLNLCGLYLGPEAELDAIGFDNKAGFWENPHFVQLLQGRPGATWRWLGLASNRAGRVGVPG